MRTIKKHHTDKMMFLDGPVEISRYDVVKYPFLDKLTQKQLGFFWRPEKTDITQDQKEFKGLTLGEQHIFTSNLKRQIVLDTKQGSAPATILGPLVSLPELETWIMTWTFFETIHSRSYTHIIRNIYPKPSEVFDTVMDIPEIVECAADIGKYYDRLEKLTAYRIGHKVSDHDRYELKKALWLCLNAINALEGIRFYVSFACSWAFAEMKKMEGNAKIIKEIARDENLHLASTQQILKILPKDDPDFVKIAEECAPEVLQMFMDVINQEKTWAKFLFTKGSMIGLNEEIMCDYVDFIGNKRMRAIGVESPFKTGPNPLPWTQKWIAGADVQVAPQETEVEAYIEGGVKQDLKDDSFAGFSL